MALLSDKIVVKVGTSSLTYKNGKMKLKNIEALCKVLSDLHNSGKQIILVSSGAIGVGVGKLGLKKRPDDNAQKQALAAVGQCELMFIYDKFFGDFNNLTAQVLLTADDIQNPERRTHVENTFTTLLNMDIIPVVNENDTVAVDELEGQHIGDNDTLSAIVASLIKADMLIILTDTDGMYDKDPSRYPDAKRIPVITDITHSLRTVAGGSGTNRGTGGMATKLHAADISMKAGINCCIMKSDRPERIYDLLEGKDIGTFFNAGGKNDRT
jgi:glutamate 5-kinase